MSGQGFRESKVDKPLDSCTECLFHTRSPGFVTAIVDPDEHCGGSGLGEVSGDIWRNHRFAMHHVGAFAGRVATRFPVAVSAIADRELTVRTWAKLRVQRQMEAP